MFFKAEDFDEVPYISESNNNDSGVGEVIDNKHDANGKVWVRCVCIGGNTKTLDFYFGLHEYEG